MSRTVSGTMTKEVVVMVVMMVMMPWMIPVRAVPTPMEAIPIIRTVPIVVVIPRIVISIVIGIIVVSIIAVWIETPIPGIIYINIGVASARVIVVIIVERGTSSGSEPLDACCEVGIIVSLGSGIDHAVSVGHRLCGLIHRVGVRHVVLTVGIISLIIVSATAANARCHRAAIAAVGLLAVRRVIRRIIGVVIGHPLLRGTTDDGQNCQKDGDDSYCFHFRCVLIKFSIFAA